MFKKIIKSHIDCTKRYLDKIERAYEETYAETSKELNSQIEKIREKNKKKFLMASESWIKDKIKEETGLEAPDFVAKQFAKQFWNIAVEKGDLDEFNNLKNE